MLIHKFQRIFIEANVRVIESGQKVCGGKRPTIVQADDDSETLHIVEESCTWK